MGSKFYEKRLLVVISSPSGAGKTTVCRNIIKIDKNIKLSISDTTREPRDNEKNGVDYNFLTIDKFKQKIKEGKFLEHAKVFENFYGTSSETVENFLKNDYDVLFDIDWQGASQISRNNFAKLVKIFISAPSENSVYERLKKRSIQTGDDDQSIIKRMSQYNEEMSHSIDYNYVIINDNVDKCTNDILRIINSERKKLN